MPSWKSSLYDNIFSKRWQYILIANSARIVELLVAVFEVPNRKSGVRQCKLCL